MTSAGRSSVVVLQSAGWDLSWRRSADAGIRIKGPLVASTKFRLNLSRMLKPGKQLDSCKSTLVCFRLYGNNTEARPFKLAHWCWWSSAFRSKQGRKREKIIKIATTKPLCSFCNLGRLALFPPPKTSSIALVCLCVGLPEKNKRYSSYRVKYRDHFVFFQ